MKKIVLLIAIAAMFCGCATQYRTAIDRMDHEPETYDTPAPKGPKYESIEFYLDVLDLYGDRPVIENQEKFRPTLTYSSDRVITKEELYVLMKLSAHYEIVLNIYPNGSTL